jgi:2,3-bisphosphoglycerate-independent phosphoglycerate mutase
MKKILFIVLDGLGDEAIPALDGKTPLEAAKTPYLDFLVKHGRCGLVVPKFRGATPTSEECHFVMFGYDPAVYKIRRGIVTATGTGMKVEKSDVALRGNFATVGKGLTIIDRRAGRIKNARSLIKALNGMKIDGATFFLKGASEHRVGIVMKGRNLSPNISDGDPHYGKLGTKARRIRPLDRDPRSKRTAKVLNEFLKQSHEILENHPLNKKRRKKNLLPANYLLVRGASSLPKLPSFKETYDLKAVCVAGKILYKQIARLLGMRVLRVRGATGLFDTNLRAKFTAAKKALTRYDFVFMHIKAADSLAEDGNFVVKKEFIERIDKKVKRLLTLRNVLIVVTSDHSTCSLLRRHCKQPNPLLVFGAGRDEVKRFSEKECKKGSLGRIKQIDLMKKVLEWANDL